jgi:hypothetical protein
MQAIRAAQVNNPPRLAHQPQFGMLPRDVGIGERDVV